MQIPGTGDGREPVEATASAKLKDSTIDRVRKVVESKQASRIDGVLLDFFTASTVVQIYNRLTGERKEKFAGLPIKQMVHRAFQIADKAR